MTWFASSILLLANIMLLSTFPSDQHELETLFLQHVAYGTESCLVPETNSQRLGDAQVARQMILYHPSCVHAVDELGRNALSIACCMVCDHWLSLDIASS